MLVLSPTRELAVQINAECIKFGKHAGVSSTCVYGGAPIAAQQSALSKLQPTVVVATPGRLCDLLTRSSLSLSSAAYVVLDEADRMLDMGFEPQIKQVFGALPTARQTLFFTATWPKSVRKLAESFLRSGDHLARVFIGTSADAELEANTAVTQTFIQARDDEKDQKMYELLQTLSEEARVVVFANTKRRVDVCARNFAEFGTVAVHGDKQQHERERSLRSFIKGEQPLMFATDVAARGLDIKGVRCNCLLRPIGERSLVLKLGCCCCGQVTHVINFGAFSRPLVPLPPAAAVPSRKLPLLRKLQHLSLASRDADMARDVESYVHRIGRTGRAGELGQSVTFWVRRGSSVTCLCPL